MSYTQIDGAIVNNLTMSQYKELRAANALNSNEAYCITDIDEYIDNACSSSGGKSICMAKLNSNQSVTSGDKKLTLQAAVTSGPDLSVSGNGIMCAKAGVIKVNAFLSLDFGTATVPYITIKQNSTNIAKVILEECDPYISFSDILVNVNAGDCIYLYIETMQNRVTAQAANNGTRLTVEYV